MFSMDFGKILYFYTISVKAMRMNLQSAGSESVIKSGVGAKLMSTRSSAVERNVLADAFTPIRIALCP